MTHTRVLEHRVIIPRGVRENVCEDLFRVVVNERTRLLPCQPQERSMNAVWTLLELHVGKGVAASEGAAGTANGTVGTGLAALGMMSARHEARSPPAKGKGSADEGSGSPTRESNEVEDVATTCAANL